MGTKTKYFDSSQADSPVLSGTAGTLIAVLDAVLVNGFGSRTVTSISVASNVATANFSTGHPFHVDSVGVFSGITPSGLNGEKRILSVGANLVTFAAPGVADGSGSGSMSSKVAGAGWTKAYSDTNAAAYKMGGVEGTGFYLQILDTGTTCARVRGYEHMTDVSTGTGPIPLDAQVSGGLFWPKSNAASSAVRDWQIVADDRGFYFGNSPTSGERYTVMYAGDILSLKSGDAYGFVVTGSEVDETNTSSIPSGCIGYSTRSRSTGAYLARLHTALGQAVPAQRVGAHHNAATAEVYAGSPGYSFPAYPNAPNNGLLTGALELINTGIRGTFPGLLHPIQDLGVGGAFANRRVIDGTGYLAGRRLLAMRVGTPAAGSVVSGTIFFDISGAWRE